MCIFPCVVTLISFFLIGVSAYSFSILWYRFKNLVTPKSTMHIAQQCKCKNHWCKYLLLIHQSFPNLGISSWNPCISQISKQTLKKKIRFATKLLSPCKTCSVPSNTDAPKGSRCWWFQGTIKSPIIGDFVLDVHCVLLVIMFGM